MTEEELKQEKFHRVYHLSMETEHISTYENENGRLGFCRHTQVKDDYTFGRTIVHFRIDGNIYKTKKKFLEALKDYNPNLKTEKI